MSLFPKPQLYLSAIVRSVIMSSEEVEGGMKDVSLWFEGLIFQE